MTLLDQHHALPDSTKPETVQWAGFEVKVDSRPETLDRAAQALVNLAAKFTTAPPPVALGIMTATGPSYTRPDGVHIINIQHLGA